MFVKPQVSQPQTRVSSLVGKCKLERERPLVLDRERLLDVESEMKYLPHTNRKARYVGIP